MEQIVYGNLRVQLLSEEIVRVELGKKGVFCDKNTFLIPNRTDYEGTHPAYTQEGNIIFFGGYELYLPENGASLKGVRLEKNGKRVYGYKKIPNSGELPAFGKTPEAFAIADAPRIIVPEGGYSAYRKGEYTVADRVQDIYLLLCGKDAKKLRRLYVELTGRCEFVRLSSLGGWNSKYYEYNEESAKQLILDYEKHGVPLDVMVIDTDWRSCENGWGYDVNTNLFPDMKRFFDFAHSHGVEIMFNDHPEPVDGAQIFAPEEIAYREKNLQALMEKGLDIWWYDRNWMTRLVSPTGGIHHETLGLYLFTDVTRHFYQKQAKSKEIYRRPVIMGNLDNVSNGTYVSVFSSASHRYSVQWTGDISSDMQALAQEIGTLLRASDNCVVYTNSDCGGHLGNPDKEEFIRWMQFGTLSPVFRPHCTKGLVRSREPWVFDEETLDIVRAYNNLRYRLLPVIYKNAYESYLTGEPAFKSLGWEYPRDKKALARKDEYLLGNDILIAPVAGGFPEKLPKKCYTAPVEAVFYRGRDCAGEPIAQAVWKSLDMNLRGEAPVRGVPVCNFSARFKTAVRFEEDTELYITTDDGCTVWLDGEKVHEDKTEHSALSFPLGRCSAGKTHSLEIEYFQDLGEACCILTVAKANKGNGKEVYLPKGKWLDLFAGKMYGGGKTAQFECGLREMPLFVRLGALLPLAYEAKNTREQKWDELVYDFYPDKSAKDEGYLYEDDTETTAYKLGQFRKSAHSAEYCAECNAFVVKFSSAEGSFEGSKCFDSRSVVLRCHELGNRISRVSVNGEEVPLVRIPKDASAFPLNTDGGTPDGSIVRVALKTPVTRANEIKFYL